MRFTISDVLWLTVVASVAFAWWLDHTQFVERESVASKLIWIAKDDHEMLALEPGKRVLVEMSDKGEVSLKVVSGGSAKIERN